LRRLQSARVGVVPFSPLGRGFLTGTIDEPTKLDSSDLRSAIPRFTPEARKANRALVDVVADVAARKHMSPAQIALAWLGDRAGRTRPAPAARREARL
jgi:aryl-alcohol dehydrogenase-like predicted oxidoreductase